MDKYSRYYGLIPFVVLILVVALLVLNVLLPKIQQIEPTNHKLQTKKAELSDKQTAKRNIEQRKIQLKNASINAQKKIFSPMESDVGNDSLFFTLYSDLIEMLNANSVKIKTMEYVYNPEEDAFVKSGKDYFVCELKMELISNYVNLGKFIQDVYQYPYYVKINYMDTKPYPKDKKILVTHLGLSLYARTQPEEAIE